ncbi:hypothetical protein YC2023_010103 [Brassica napus]
MTVLISDLLVESSGDEVDKVKMIPFEVEQAQGLPKTKHPFNCGIFLVKILECQSLKIGDMTKINDDNALELRRTLSCEIFNQFVSKTNTFRLEKDKTLAVSTLSPFQTSRISLVSASRISLSSPYLSISDENPSPELSLSRSFTRALSILREKPFLELYLFKTSGRICIVSGNPS